MKATIRFGLSAIITLTLTVPVMAGQPGALKWAFTTGGKVSSSPALSKEGIIYVGSEDGKVYAINPDGSKKWEFSTGGSNTCSPMISDQGIIYVSSADGKLYAINPDGTYKWDFEFGAVSDNYGGVNYALGSYQNIYLRVSKYVPYGCFLYVIDPANKATLLQTMEELNGGPAIGPDGTVYLSGWSDWKVRIFAFNRDGARKWDFPMDTTKIFYPVSIARDGTIYVASNVGIGYWLYALAPSGFQKWALLTEWLGNSSPVIDVYGTIYVFTYNVIVQAPSATSGFMGNRDGAS